MNLLVDVGFNREVAEDGALYWKRSDDDLARLIDKVDNMSAGEITSLGSKAKKRVSEEYTWEKIAGKYKKLFLEGIKQKYNK